MEAVWAKVLVSWGTASSSAVSCVLCNAEGDGDDGGRKG